MPGETKSQRARRKRDSREAEKAAPHETTLATLVVSEDDENLRSRSPASRPVQSDTDLSVNSSPSQSPTTPTEGNDDAFTVSPFMHQILAFR